ncbi:MULTISPECIES: molybdenum cofactor biosynthesis protein MoaE [Brevibacterium]|uniref:Molybdenum cofactor biosynthesis protein MoaE n=3 Tax=Bacteria TaxID=2 RepID=A0A165DEY7_9MICO|nr:molybdenum cofactor biosynthesis protein MoaE [Brevibacterium casei]SIJ06938.1 molybdopterin biosynthesis MoaE [Mycobacteroides abscessus subsp. abscessus]KZE13733.1 molybdenum cofactor biosynthesis protein MoaE [Brevibacterium casei]MCT1446938.1 molybdenum cofactor biosynthesis protein MoaE [Brevibacterium casei]MCT1551201.1 molybdenum cofactor biosynthesis protein MoaE [Brevibacterium casei]MCT1560236.1 molybdenum cofactor biosynthesis protein MoaE [Brevibacterium casei]
MSVIRTGIVETPISTDELAPEVVTAASGASVTFSGIIRDHDSGRGVERLVYESHPLADQQLAEVAAAVARAHPEVRISVVHRVGELRIGDVALAAVVASAHRREAFAACAELIDEVKDKVAIWKHQYFSDGDDEWVGALE